MDSAVSDDYYTFVLVNPDYTLFGPVVYHMVGNLKGSDLSAYGYSDTFKLLGLYEESIEIIPWTEPMPPIWYTNYTYSYLIYKQPGGVVDYSQASTDISTWWWDATAFATQYNLELVTSNYFVAKSDPFEYLIYLFVALSANE